ncbi:hypothetical protein [Desulforhopalus singaporensis]|uniref:Uncharacterized protein n=1 Tax=Desulforhopalus singaporensis TaxID=91360 RepID=A0A1H0LHJ1_9BACT|nr:hypothetical protein [Desulforhopalus singaporensis]SDO67639.1 hypothetical protein SAMN05660330_00805 [Desulforhopalus singaporensis]
MDNPELLLGEYNNLWSEKNTHKIQLRKFKGYLSYFTSIMTGSLSIFGLSTTELFQTISNSKDPAILTQNITNVLNIISVPAVPIILLISSFAINELFQIYVIGNTIGNIEKKLNKLTGENIYSWEHKICPVVYGGKDNHNGKKLTNIILLNDVLIFFPLMLILTTILVVFALNFLYNYNLILLYSYAAILFLMLLGIIYVATKLANYTKASSQLSSFISEAINSY